MASMLEGLRWLSCARKRGSTGWHHCSRRSGEMPRAMVSRSSLALTILTSLRRLCGVCSPSPTWMWMPQLSSVMAPALRRARTTSWTMGMSSQRHTGLTTSASGSVTEESLSTVQCRPSGMATVQLSRWSPTWRATVPKCSARTWAVRARPRPVVSSSMPKVCVFTGCTPFALRSRGVFPRGGPFSGPRHIHHSARPK